MEVEWFPNPGLRKTIKRRPSRAAITQRLRTKTNWTLDIDILYCIWVPIPIWDLFFLLKSWLFWNTTWIWLSKATYEIFLFLDSFFSSWVVLGISTNWKYKRWIKSSPYCNITLQNATLLTFKHMPPYFICQKA